MLYTLSYLISYTVGMAFQTQPMLIMEAKEAAFQETKAHQL